MAIAAIVIAVVALAVSALAIFISWRMQRHQWERDDLALRLDVLRRLRGYSYRLTEELSQRIGTVETIGEPFIALNEAPVVYAKFPKVICALMKLKCESGEDRKNIVAVARAMAEVCDLPTENDDYFILTPFVPTGYESKNVEGPEGRDAEAR